MDMLHRNIATTCLYSVLGFQFHLIHVYGWMDIERNENLYLQLKMWNDIFINFYLYVLSFRLLFVFIAPIPPLAKK